jgi:hypothetical protein
MFEAVRRLFGSARKRAAPPARIFLCSGRSYNPTGIYTDRDFAQLRQIVLDRQLLGKPVPQILWEVAGPVPGCDEYVIVLWWQYGRFGSARVEETGPYDATAERAGAMQRCDTESGHRYSAAVDVTDAVMRQEPGYA